MNKKYLVNGERVECFKEGCHEGARVMGFCKSHYRRSYHEKNYVSIKKPRKNKVYVYADRNPCGEDGCLKKVKGDYCSVHKVQHEKYGFTWSGKRPTELLRQMEMDARPRCSLDGCDRASMLNDGLCVNHHNSRVRKGLSVQPFLELMKKTLCEACGSGDRVVTDHKHGHHDNKDRMCEDCIRGRLCNHCNTALGLLGEDPKRIRNLEKYIIRTQK